MQWHVKTTGSLQKGNFQLKTAEVTTQLDTLQIPSILQRDLQTVLSRLLRTWQPEVALIALHISIRPTLRQLDLPSDSSKQP